MKHIKKFTEHKYEEVNEELNSDLKKVAEKIYDLVKNRPFSHKQDTVKDIVKILTKM